MDKSRITKIHSDGQERVRTTAEEMDEPTHLGFWIWNGFKRNQVLTLMMMVAMVVVMVTYNTDSEFNVNLVVYNNFALLVI